MQTHRLILIVSSVSGEASADECLEKLAYGHGWACLACGKQDKHKGNMRRHILHNHVGEKSYKCKLCDNTFYSASHRQIHYRRVHLMRLSMKQINELDVLRVTE